MSIKSIETDLNILSIKSLKMNVRFIIREIKDLTDYYNIDSLKLFIDELGENERCLLGTHLLEKFGERHFHIYQSTARLTKEEVEAIFRSTTNFAPDLTEWHHLEDSENTAIIREKYPEAKFYKLITYEGNTREHALVFIRGNMYYFYDKIGKYEDPVTDEYIAEFAKIQEEEQRPDFFTISVGDKKIFFVKFMGERSVNLRDKEQLKQLFTLSVALSKKKKAIDLLPSRLAMHETGLYYVDPKLTYFTYPTILEAFQANTDCIKHAVQSKGFAEESELLEYIDTLFNEAINEIRQEELIELIQNAIHEGMPGYELVDHPQLKKFCYGIYKVFLAAAALRRLGTFQFYYVARDLCLSFKEQQDAIAFAGKALIDNRVIWNEISAPDEFSASGITGTFRDYSNRVGNSKPVITVEMNEKIYVIRKVDESYVEKYEARKIREHRPDYLTFLRPEGGIYFLAEFMGSETLDFSNKRHLELVHQLVCDFSSEGADERSTIDFNLGNIVIKNDKAYYIDKDLSYVQSNDVLKWNFKELRATLNNYIFDRIDKDAAFAELEHLQTLNA